jgi:hypothetical protein
MSTEQRFFTPYVGLFAFLVAREYNGRMSLRARAVIAKPFAPVGRAAAWMRGGYPTQPPCGHIALVALCCKQSRRVPRG